MRILAVCLAVVLPLLTLAYEKTVCELQLETISCPLGQFLQIGTVLYGRTDAQTCNLFGNTFTTLNCRSTSTTTNHVTSACQGRSTCLLSADNTVLGEDPCPGVPKYLKVQYSCVYTLTTGATTLPTTQSSTTPTTTATTTTATTTTATTTTPLTTRTTTTLSTSTSTVMSLPVNPNKSSASQGQVCHENLVSGSRGVPGGQLSSSSVQSLSNSARYGRLYLLPMTYPNGFHHDGGWTASSTDSQPWIQVKFNWPSIVQGVTTQGRHVDTKGCCNEWTTKYKVKYSMDGVTWDTVKEQNTDKVFIGNTDNDTPITHMFNCPITARFVRIYVTDYVKNPSLRFDVIGCPANVADIGSCPVGWKERPGSGTCYLVSDQSNPKTWDNAEITCLRNQGNLLKIDSAPERDWIHAELTAVMATHKQTAWWVGLNNIPRTDNANYKWTDATGLDTSILNWQQNQPGNTGGREHCAELHVPNNQLNDRDCDASLPFVCEKNKYWSKPINTPNVVTATPTRPTTMAPTTAVHKVPIPIGGGIVQTALNIFTTGCLNRNDCIGKQVGNYQSCTGCGFYITCAPSGVFVRPCPQGLRYDDNLGVCETVSSTCQGP